MKLDQLQRKEIVLVSGNLCSGKGYFCDTKYPEYHRIGLSQIVKELTNFKTRSELSTTKSLDNDIADTIIEKILSSPNKKFIIDGIRQITILDKLKNYFKDQIKDIIWLDTPDEVAKLRFKQRSNAKDDMDYETARQSDKDLGIEDVEKYIRANHRTETN